MEPIVIIIAVVLLVAVVAGFVVTRRPARGELLEPPPVDLGTVTPPDRVGTDERADDELVEPEVEVVDPLTGVLPPAVVITGPELTPEEEAANIAAAEAAELESEQELAAAAEAATRPRSATGSPRPGRRSRATSGRSCRAPRSMPRPGTSWRRR